MDADAPRRPEDEELCDNSTTADTDVKLEEKSSEQRKSSIEDDNARSDPLYQGLPNEDGRYHCPFAEKENCEHPPVKLKCNYEWVITPTSNEEYTYGIPASTSIPISAHSAAKPPGVKTSLFRPLPVFSVTNAKRTQCMATATSRTSVCGQTASAVKQATDFPAVTTFSTT